MSHRQKKKKKKTHKEQEQNKVMEETNGKNKMKTAGHALKCLNNIN